MVRAYAHHHRVPLTKLITHQGTEYYSIEQLQGW
jgi:hypothetical protein